MDFIVIGSDDFSSTRTVEWTDTHDLGAVIDRMKATHTTVHCVPCYLVQTLQEPK